MRHVPIKYERSTDSWRLAFEHVKQAAAQRRNVTYQQLAQIVGLPLSGQYMAREVGDLCGILSKRGMFGIRVRTGHKNTTNDFGAGKTTACTVTQGCVRS